jgi:hypothetical protein
MDTAMLFEYCRRINPQESVFLHVLKNVAPNLPAIFWWHCIEKPDILPNFNIGGHV